MVKDIAERQYRRNGDQERYGLEKFDFITLGKCKAHVTDNEELKIGC